MLYSFASVIYTGIVSWACSLLGTVSMLKFGVSRACGKLSQKPALFPPPDTLFTDLSLSSSTSVLVFAPDCLLWHVNQPGSWWALPLRSPAKGQ